MTYKWERIKILLCELMFGLKEANMVIIQRNHLNNFKGKVKCTFLDNTLIL